jgi:hypothetical protein
MFYSRTPSVSAVKINIVIIFSVVHNKRNNIVTISTVTFITFTYGRVIYTIYLLWNE